MSPQIACLRSGKVTLVALILLLPTVCFQVSHQMARLRRCILTFFLSFSTVYFQMFPQIPYPKGCIITLATFVWLAATLLSFFIWTFTLASLKLQDFGKAFPQLSCVSSSCFHQKMLQHIVHMQKAFLQCVMTKWTFKLFQHPLQHP